MNDLQEIFYKYPEKWMHIRKIAKLLSVSPNTIRKNIIPLLELDIIEKRQYNNMIEYRANLESKRFKVRKKLYMLLQIYETGLVDFLAKNYPDSPIILFGSALRGEDLSSSDIDIAIISSKNSRVSLEKFEKILHREINLSIFSKEEVSKEFMNNIINGMVLEGVL